MKTRINTIAQLVDGDIVIDVGSDHCLLAIELLSNNIAKQVINVEKNKGPYEQGIKNLVEHNLLNKTQNYINDGLLGLENKIGKHVDTIVMAGIGTNTIINILVNNKISFNQLILQSNSNHEKLRNYIVNDLKLTIVEEVYVKKNNIIYVIFNIKRNHHVRKYTKQELYFGKVETIINIELFYELLNYRLKYLIANKNILSNNKELEMEYELIKQRLDDDNKRNV